MARARGRPWASSPQGVRSKDCWPVRRVGHVALAWPSLPSALSERQASIILMDVTFSRVLLGVPARRNSERPRWPSFSSRARGSDEHRSGPDHLLSRLPPSLPSFPRPLLAVGGARAWPPRQGARAGRGRRPLRGPKALPSPSPRTSARGGRRVPDGGAAPASQAPDRSHSTICKPRTKDHAFLGSKLLDA